MIRKLIFWILTYSSRGGCFARRCTLAICKVTMISNYQLQRNWLKFLFKDSDYVNYPETKIVGYVWDYFCIVELLLFDWINTKYTLGKCVKIPRWFMCTTLHIFAGTHAHIILFVAAYAEKRDYMLTEQCYGISLPPCQHWFLSFTVWSLEDLALLHKCSLLPSIIDSHQDSFEQSCMPDQRTAGFLVKINTSIQIVTVYVKTLYIVFKVAIMMNIFSTSYCFCVMYTCNMSINSNIFLFYF
jgi:hypothetical protein